MAQGESVQNGIGVQFHWAQDVVKEDGTLDQKHWTFRPPEGMDFDGVVEYLNSNIGKQWEDDEDTLRMMTGRCTQSKAFSSTV